MNISQFPVKAQPLLPVRLIASDLDGTLLRDDGSISDDTCRLLEEIQSAGIIVALATARPPRMIRAIAATARVSGLAICCNGAIIYDLQTDTILQQTQLQPELIQGLINEFRRAITGVCFAVEFGQTFGCDPEYERLQPAARTYASRIDEALILAHMPATRLIVRHQTLAPDRLAEIAASIAGDSVSITRSGPFALDITVANVHKGSALAQICSWLNISRQEVMAFGDMPNDIAMLRWAGYAVAVANADPLVLQHADEITLSNLEDGVAHVLARLINMPTVLR